MKEIADIVRAYRKASSLGLKTALATVVRVEGSSYRQPGARKILKLNEKDVAQLPFEKGAIDIDSIEDYNKLKGK